MHPQGVSVYEPIFLEYMDLYVEKVLHELGTFKILAIVKISYQVWQDPYVNEYQLSHDIRG